MRKLSPLTWFLILCVLLGSLRVSVVLSQPSSPTRKDPTEEHLRALAKKIMTAINNKDMKTVAKAVHPDKGVRFAPYACLNRSDLVFFPQQVAHFATDSQEYVWGLYDSHSESIDKIIATPMVYMKQFVNDRNYLKAHAIEFNGNIGGKIPDLAGDMYPLASSISFFYNATDPDGQNWKRLKLVFEKKKGQWFLIAITHNQWSL